MLITGLNTICNPTFSDLQPPIFSYKAKLQGPNTLLLEIVCTPNQVRDIELCLYFYTTSLAKT